MKNWRQFVKFTIFRKEATSVSIGFHAGPPSLVVLKFGNDVFSEGGNLFVRR